MTTRATAYADTVCKFAERLCSEKTKKEVVACIRSGIEITKDVIKAGAIIKERTEKKVEQLAKDTLPEKYASIAQQAFKSAPIATVYIFYPQIAVRGALIYAVSHIATSVTNREAVHIVNNNFNDMMTGLVVGSTIKGCYAALKFVVTGNPADAIMATVDGITAVSFKSVLST